MDIIIFLIFLFAFSYKGTLSNFESKNYDSEQLRIHSEKNKDDNINN